MKAQQTAARQRPEKSTNGSGDPLGTNSEIGRKLKRYYDDLVSDEVPDRFADLLKQLEDSEHAGADGKATAGKVE